MLEKTTLTECLDKCPGLAGHIARYINDAAETHQPGIALSTAIAFVGALRSDRIICEQGIAPSIYTCAIAPSGVGKSRSQQVISDLCSQCNLTHLLMGRPASDSGILKRLQEFPRQFLIWDEFGLALSEMSKSSASYRVAIIAMMMDLFSAAGRVHIGRQYANQARIDVQKPYLSICAASTPSRFYGALTKDFIDDGFLSRLLVFESEVSIEFKDPSVLPFPEKLIEQIKRIDQGIPLQSGGDLSMIIDKEKIVLEFEDEQDHEILKKNAQRKIMKATSEVSRIFWSRGYEQAMKLCMIFSDEFGFCSSRTTVFVWELIELLIESIIERCTKDIYDTQSDKLQEKRMRKFIDLIAPGETVSLSEMTKKAFNLGFHKKEKLAKLEDVLENGIWTQIIKTSEDSFRKTTLYSRVK